MAELAHVGDCCPYQDCPDYGNLHAGTIIRFGKTRQGRQRFRCKSCLRTFNENYGTIFHGKRTDEDQIIETLALIAEGSRVSSLARVKGFKEDTILGWLDDAAEHVGAVEEVLMKHYQIDRVQLDGLWSYVGHKGRKKTTQRPTPKVNSGALP